MDEIIFDDKTYVSSKRAAQITGYAKDYVGQLCREGRVEARLVGRNWYVLETSLREHRFGPETPKESPKIAPNTESTAWESPQYVSEPVSTLEIPDTNATERDHTETVQEMQNAWQDWFSRRIDSMPLEEAFLESTDIIDAREEAIEESIFEEEESVETVPLHRSYAVEEVVETPVPPTYQTSTEEQEETVPIHRSFAPEPVSYMQEIVRTQQPLCTPQEPVYAPTEPFMRPEGRILRERRVIKKKKPSVALQALFLSLAGVAIAIAVIGSGEIDSFLNQNRLNYAPINFLGGEKVVNNSSK